MNANEDALDERKEKILNAIIRNYLETGEPVGSRTISKYTDLHLSSATIRNEMSDLEEMGYILQPHTSAGRIPSDKGYRFYVDHLMEEKDREIAEMKEYVLEKTQKVDEVLQQAAKLLATNTNYATMVSAPSYQQNKIKFIQLSQMDEGQILAVVVMNTNTVRNQMIPVSEMVDDDTLLRLNILLNTALCGLSIEEINLAMITRLKEQAGIHKGIVGDIIDALAESLSEGEDLEIFTSGTTNFFKYPELADSQNAAKLVSTFEEKDELRDFVKSSLSDEQDGEGGGISVYIGNESPLVNMQDCSVVTATYELGEGVKGTIGIIGPKRMDYEKVVDNLRTLKKQLDGIFEKT